jgi:hypothetical protein
MTRTSVDPGYGPAPRTFAAFVALFALLLSAPLASLADAAKRKPVTRAACLKAAKKRSTPAARRSAAKRCPKAKRTTTSARTTGPAPQGAPPVPGLAPAPLSPTTLGPSPSPAVPAATPGTDQVPQSPPAATTQPNPCGDSPWVGYTATDLDGVFRFTGKRTCVPGPTVSFQLRNVDAQEHNLYAEGTAPAAPKRAIIASVAPEETKEATTTLSKGEWRLFCDIRGHETMSRTLTVTG